MSSTDVMVLVVAAVAVLAAWLVAVRARAELHAHRVAYPHTAEDLLAARRDSVARSHAVVSGKVREHLTPLLPEFATRFAARDARFLGSPVDFVVFDGLDAGSVERVVFVEVKTGSAGLSTRERRVREAVEQGRVEWQLLRLPAADPGDGVVPPADPPEVAARSTARPARRRRRRLPAE